MIKILTIYLATFLLGSSIYSQVVIDQADMPKLGDTLRVSVTNLVPAGFSQTAMDTTWNFAELEALGQRIDTFVTATSTPSAYQLFFVILGGANLASPRNGMVIPGVPLTQGYAFFKNSEASYGDLGSAYTLLGVPIPAKYDNPDTYYEFPLTPGKIWASTASFSISIPQMVYYSTRRTRSNVVDGYGTLITPFGSFQTVRVKSTLNIHDSIYIDSLSIGFPFNRDITEYKWLGKDQGIPLLQVNEEGSLITANYRDIYRMSALPLSVTLGPDTAVLKGTILTLHATVSNGTPPYQIFWNTLASGDSITVTVEDDQTYSVIVVDALQNIGMAQKVVSVKYPPGIEEMNENLMNIYPNPAQDQVTIIIPERDTDAVFQLFTAQGKMIRESGVHLSSGKFTASLAGLEQGIFFAKLATKNRTYAGKIQIIR